SRVEPVVALVVTSVIMLTPCQSQALCRPDLLSKYQGVLDEDGLPSPADLPQAVLGVRVSHGYVAAAFEPVGNVAAVLSITNPKSELARCRSLKPINGHGIGSPEQFKDIRQFGILGSPMGVSNSPKRLCLRWRLLGIERREIKIC